MLVILAEHGKERKPTEEKKKKRRVLPWVEQLCSEPEWVEEKPEVGDAWVEDGWKNPSAGSYKPAPKQGVSPVPKGEGPGHTPLEEVSVGIGATDRKRDKWLNKAT
jgi:hypothetical protein